MNSRTTHSRPLAKLVPLWLAAIATFGCGDNEQTSTTDGAVEAAADAALDAKSQDAAPDAAGDSTLPDAAQDASVDGATSGVEVACILAAPVRTEPGQGANACPIPEVETVHIYSSEDDFTYGEPLVAENIALGTQAGEPTTAKLVFRNIDLERNADLASARLEVISSSNYPFDETDEGADIVEIRAELLPVEVAEGVCHQVLTQASVEWDTGTWTNEERIMTPDLSALVEEVVAQPSWLNGDSIRFMITTQTVSGYGRAFWSVDRAEPEGPLAAQRRGSRRWG